jgi:hypothetical protein
MDGQDLQDGSRNHQPQIGADSFGEILGNFFLQQSVVQAFSAARSSASGMRFKGGKSLKIKL